MVDVASTFLTLHPHNTSQYTPMQLLERIHIMAEIITLFTTVMFGIFCVFLYTLIVTVMRPPHDLRNDDEEKSGTKKNKVDKSLI